MSRTKKNEGIKKSGLNVYEKIAYPSDEEIQAAQLACCGRNCKACEAPAAYAWRKREVDLAILLEKAIKTELTATEREIITARWFDGLGLTEISRKRKTAPSSVKSALTRAQKKLERVLGYVVDYQQNVVSETVDPIFLGKARAIAAARNASGGTAGERLARLRIGENLSYSALSKAVGIAESRLMKLERGAVAKSDELVPLSRFFNVAVDYLLKGERTDEQK